MRLSFAAFALLASAMTAEADKIANPVAVFSGLDKITGRIVTFDVAVDETVQFGSLQLTPRVCFSRPQTEAPKTTAFVEVEEVDAANQLADIFKGWVFAASPGLSAIDHAVYDIWLTECKGGTTIIKTPDEEDEPALLVAGTRGVEPLEDETVDAQVKKPKKKKGAGQPKQKFFPTAITPAGQSPDAPISLTPQN
jgi:hypothetical protein